VSALREFKAPLVRAGALFLHADPYLNEDMFSAGGMMTLRERGRVWAMIPPCRWCAR
jgi:hypothetical protein